MSFKKNKKSNLINFKSNRMMQYLIQSKKFISRLKSFRSKKKKRQNNINKNIKKMNKKRKNNLILIFKILMTTIPQNSYKKYRHK